MGEDAERVPEEARREPWDLEGQHAKSITREAIKFSKEQLRIAHCGE